jgi:hypothetical protein
LKDKRAYELSTEAKRQEDIREEERLVEEKKEKFYKKVSDSMDLTD